MSRHCCVELIYDLTPYIINDKKLLKITCTDTGEKIKTNYENKIV